MRRWRRFGVHRYAIFVRRLELRRGRYGFGTARFLGHLIGGSTGEATVRGRETFRLIVRAGDRIEVRSDNGTRSRKYGTGAPAPAGTGTL